MTSTPNTITGPRARTSAVTQPALPGLPIEPLLTLGRAAEEFLAARDLRPATTEAYADTLTMLKHDLGADTPLAHIHVDDIQHFLTRWSSRAPATFNRHRSAVSSLWSWATDQQVATANIVDQVPRREGASNQQQRDRPIPYPRLAAIWDAQGTAARERALWRLLYDTAARAKEILALDVEDLDPDARSALVTGEYGHERVHWTRSTGRLLRDLIHGRTTGPLFLTARRRESDDGDTTTGKARLSYRRAEQQWSDASDGTTLHQLRHSALMHLARQGADPGLLLAKSRHQSRSTARRYERAARNAKQDSRHAAN